MLGHMKERGRTQPSTGAQSRTDVACVSGFSLFVDILARDAIQSLSRRRERRAAADPDHDNCDATGGNSSSPIPECSTVRHPVVADSDAEVSPSSDGQRNAPLLQQATLFD